MCRHLQNIIFNLRKLSKFYDNWFNIIFIDAMKITPHRYPEAQNRRIQNPTNNIAVNTEMLQPIPHKRYDALLTIKPT